jgi:lactoylglutathione lyase
MLRSQINGIAHIGIRVHDLARARAFYETLGFDFVVGPVGPEPVAILKHPSGVVVNFILNASQEQGPNMLMDVKDKYSGYTHVAFAVRDVSAVQSALKAAGITITEGPIIFPGGTVSIFVRDPDSNVIEFNQEVS